jgi:predicted ATP-binding protein involved in virulence
MRRVWRWVWLGRLWSRVSADVFSLDLLLKEGIVRINKLTVKNFKGFEDRTFEFPQAANVVGNGSFHLLIGQNGKGKTSALDALAVAAGSWLLGVHGFTDRPVTEDDVRLVVLDFGDTARIEKQLPVWVAAEGVVAGEALAWTRELEAGGAGSAKAENIRLLAEKTVSVSQGSVSLPLISYYGTGRLWDKPYSITSASEVLEAHTRVESMRREQALTDAIIHLGVQLIEKEPARKLTEAFVKLLAAPTAPITEIGPTKEFASRLAGYSNSIIPLCSADELLNWLKFEQQLAIQDGRESTQFITVKEAIKQAIEGCTKVEYHLRLGLLLDIEGQPRLPFAALSDGQRNMLAMIGDIAWKAAQLNPHLGKEVLQKTPGIVLIDELDLHLHPKWQRHVIEDLRRLFPEIQFIATTHSPFIIQTAREGELIKLDGEVGIDPGGKTLEEIARLIMDVTDSDRSPRYQAKLDVAHAYMTLVAESKTATPERRAEIQQELVAKLAPFSDNPAYTALLERKGVIQGDA